MNNILTQSGVKGMKWGVRKARKQAVEKQLQPLKNQAIERINKKQQYESNRKQAVNSLNAIMANSKKMDDSIAKKKYFSALVAGLNISSSIDDLSNSTERMRYTRELKKQNEKELMLLRKEIAKKRKELNTQYKKHGTLTQSGVKGMKWGVRKARIKSLNERETRKRYEEMHTVVKKQRENRKIAKELAKQQQVITPNLIINAINRRLILNSISKKLEQDYPEDFKNKETRKQNEKELKLLKKHMKAYAK